MSPSPTSANARGVTPQRPSWWHREKQGLILGLIMLVPSIPLLFTPLAAGMSLTFPGMIVAMQAVLYGGARKGAIVTAVAVVAIGIAPIGLNYPWLGALFVAALGLLVGYAAYRGLDQPAYTGAWLVGMTMILGPALTAPQLADGVTVTPSYILILTALTAVGGAWMFVVMLLLTRKMPARPLDRLPRERAIVYGVTLAILTGPVALVALTWFKFSLVGWVILTVYIMVRPKFKGTDVVHGTERKVLNRGLGTVAGVLIASVIALFVHNPNVLVLIGAVLLGPALDRLISGYPYWQYVVLFTPAMVFLDANGVNIPGTAVERVVCTFIGLGLALASLWFNGTFTFAWILKSEQRRALAAP